MVNIPLTPTYCEPELLLQLAHYSSLAEELERTDSHTEWTRVSAKSVGVLAIEDLRVQESSSSKGNFQSGIHVYLFAGSRSS